MPSVKQQYTHPVLGEITLSQSRRSRRVAIAIRPSCSVRLSYPHGVSTRRALQFLEDKVEWIVSARAKMRERYPELPSSPPAERKARVEELRRQAKVDLPSRVERISRMTGLCCGRVGIRASRSKWGSCSSRNDLSLSLFMMDLPEHLRDYVIVHELCHTIHHNHSARFHALVDKHLCGREKELAGELRRFRIAE